MASVEQLKKQLQNIRQQIQNKLPDIAITMTVTAKALAERNIREVGFGAQYSGNPIPAWLFQGHAKSKAGENFIKSKMDKGEEMTWADLRVAEGLPTDHVDLGFTNKMWAGMGPQQPFYNGGTIVCPLGGNSVEVINKMNWNRDRYGDFLGKVLQEKEINIITVVVVDEIKEIFENNGITNK